MPQKNNNLNGKMERPQKDKIISRSNNFERLKNRGEPY
jgi:hypothetical protein